MEDLVIMYPIISRLSIEPREIRYIISRWATLYLLVK